MYFSKSALVLTFACFLFETSFTLQVAPGSPCSTLCIDSSGGNPSVASSSNTGFEDISCSNGDYTSTDVGKKFQSCMSCLQTSSYSSNGENDQDWFLYNLRYTVDYCLFGTNTTIGGPCLMAESCQPLQQALDGNLDPTEPMYDYCTADGSAFLGDAANRCQQCLHGSSDSNYLSNFIVALSAGCQQKPGPSGTILGLNQTVFSTTLVAITSPSRPASASSTHSGLPMGAKIGIIIGAIIILLVAIGFAFICFKKRRARKAALSSGYDPRFGAPNITAPNSHAYSNASHQSSDTRALFQVPGSLTSHPSYGYDPEKAALHLSELNVKLSRPASNETDFTSSSSSHGSPEPSPQPPPSILRRSQTPMPVHTAYISTTYSSHTTPTQSPAYTFSDRSPQNSPPMPPPRSISSVGLRRAPTPLAGNTNYSRTDGVPSPQNSPPIQRRESTPLGYANFSRRTPIPSPQNSPPIHMHRAPTPLAGCTNFSRDDSGPKTGGSTKSANTIRSNTSPATSPRQFALHSIDSSSDNVVGEIMHISPPQPQTLTRAGETPYDRFDEQIPSQPSQSAEGLIHPSLQGSFATAAAPSQEVVVPPPRSESRAGTRLLTKVLTKTGVSANGNGAPEDKKNKAWSPDSPESVEQWPGTM